MVSLLVRLVFSIDEIRMDSMSASIVQVGKILWKDQVHVVSFPRAHCRTRRKSIQEFERDAS